MHRPVVNEYSMGCSVASRSQFHFLNEMGKSDRCPLMEEEMNSRKNHPDFPKFQRGNPS
jgi:hypothetical protein